ncbi:MAG: hybrid sensor histidine kinase/response regulator [Xenococcus sp. MO_188.B8]|nr:hybrid sensor histidine kinase/response regulator [Xenococcus sp. MO_188.B8]
MIIEDEELRELYKTSSSEHLQKLEAELMQLEKNPQDTEALESFLREAHTLKGDSRMLGLDEIEMLVHQIEDSVEEIKQGKGIITSEFCDRLYQGLDAVNHLAHAAITGEPSNVKAIEVLALLMGAESESSQGDLLDHETGGESSDESSLFDDDEDLFDSQSMSESSFFDEEDDLFSETPEPINDSGIFKLEPIADSETSKVAKSAKVSPSVRDQQIDTIRVEPQKLDTLMTQASELTVTKLRISQQVSDIDHILTLWSQWQKDTSTHLSWFDQIAHSLSPEQLQPLQYWFDNTRQRLEFFGSSLDHLKIKANEDLTSLEAISERLESGIQGLRQLPLANVFNLFPRMVRDLARQQDKEIELIIEGGDTKADKKILEEIKDPLLHLMRNAIDHGIETPQERMLAGKPAKATIILRGYQTGSSIGIAISDDGRGLSLERIKNTAIRRNLHTPAELDAMSEAQIRSLIFASGFSTKTEITELSGRGVGLDVVRANVERLKGSIQVNSIFGQGCQFEVLVNTSLATTKVIIVEIEQTLYALPVEFIQTMLKIPQSAIFAIEDSQAIEFEGRPISIAWLRDLLQLSATQKHNIDNNLSCAVLRVDNEYFALIVDAFVDQQDIVLKPQSKLLKRVPNIAGATIIGNGEVCMILNPSDLLHSLRHGTWEDVTQRTDVSEIKNKLLLVEDSIIIRTQMQRLLKGAGYDVTVAVDGLEGWQKVTSGNFDVVVSDVEMPNMNGLELTTQIRQHSDYQNLPIILVTTLASSEAKQRGRDAGANAYLTKGDFDQKILFDTLNQLLVSE